MNQHTNKISINCLLFIVPFLMGCGVDLYVPSLPFITHQFDVSSYYVQMTIAIYMLGYGIGQTILGVLSDLFGRKKIMLMSAVLYTLISIIAALHTPTIIHLNAYRFIQGIAIAGLAVVSRAMATDCYRGLNLSKVMTFITTSYGLGPILGPIIGAYLQYYFNWEADFYFFAVYGFIIMLFTFVIPETHTSYAISNYKQVVRRMISISFNPVFISYSFWASLVYSTLILFGVVGPFLIQNTFHYSVIQYGKITLALGLAYFSGTITNRILLNYIDPKRIMIIGLIVMLILSFIMFGSGNIVAASISGLIAQLWLINFICGIVFPNAMTACFKLFPQSAGTASAFFGTWLGTAVFLVTTSASSLGINSQQGLAGMLISIYMISLMLLICGTFLHSYYQYEFQG